MWGLKNEYQHKKRGGFERYHPKRLYTPPFVLGILVFFCVCGTFADLSRVRNVYSDAMDYFFLSMVRRAMPKKKKQGSGIDREKENRSSSLLKKKKTKRFSRQEKKRKYDVKNQPFFFLLLLRKELELEKEK